MTYIAFLFGVAFVLVLLSFLIQQKDSRQTISELNQNANSALSRAEQLQDNNRELLEANQALQDQVVQLQADLDETSKNYSQLEETTHRSRRAMRPYKPNAQSRSNRSRLMSCCCLRSGL